MSLDDLISRVSDAEYVTAEQCLKRSVAAAVVRFHPEKTDSDRFLEFVQATNEANYHDNLSDTGRETLTLLFELFAQSINAYHEQ